MMRGDPTFCKLVNDIATRHEELMDYRVGVARVHAYYKAWCCIQDPASKQRIAQLACGEGAIANVSKYIRDELMDGVKAQC